MGLVQRLSGAVAIVVLTGCGSLQRTPYMPPETVVPTQWQNGITHGQPGGTSKWWQNFGDPVIVPTQWQNGITHGQPGGTTKWWQNFSDPVLDKLVESVLARNGRIVEAAITVRRAQLQAGLAGDQRNPTFGSSADANFNRGLSRDNNNVARGYSVAGPLNYEADIWGKLETKYDAALLEAQATVEDQESVVLSVVSTTMFLYWQVAYLNERIALSEQNIASTQRILELTRIRHGAGALAPLEVRQAEQTLFSQQATLSQLLQQLVEAKNALAILFDGPPQNSYPELKRLPTASLPPVEMYLPAHMVGRRPDLRASEFRLRQALAATDSTRTSYYPTLKLTSSLGSSSTELVQLLKNPIAALGAGLTLPFLQYREMQLNRQISEADYEKAVVTFRQTLYRALSEVENALSARIQFEAEEEFLKKSLYAATEVEKITEIRYRAGAIPLRLLLDAQQTRREVEAAVSSNTLNRLTNRVNIYIAFGGDTSDRNNPADSHHRTPDFRPDSDAFTFPGMQNAKRPDFQPPESESPSTGK